MMTDGEIAAAVEIAVAVVRQDQCSAGYHDWRRSDVTGVPHRRCDCGCVHPDDLDRFLNTA